jgi:hypothetical protein
MDFVIDLEDRESVVQELMSFLYNSDEPLLFHLRGFHECSPNYAHTNEYLLQRSIPSYSSQIRNYYIDTSVCDFDTYLNARYNKNAIHSLKRMEERLNNLAPLFYERLDVAELEGKSQSLLQSVFELHNQRWKRKIGSSSFSDQNARAFFIELLTNKELPFHTTIDVLRFDSKPISFICMFHYKDISILKRIAHDDLFHFFSPGKLILHKNIEKCFQANIKMLSFGIGEDPYKEKFTDDFYHLHSVVFPSSHPIAKAAHIKNHLIFTAVDIIRKNKELKIWLQKNAGKLKFLRSGEPLNKLTRKTSEMFRQGSYQSLIAYFSRPLHWIRSNTEHVVLQRWIFEQACSVAEAYTADSSIPVCCTDSDGSISVRRASIDDIEVLAAIMNQSTDEVIRRMERQQQCILGLKEGEIIHYTWINQSVIEIPKSTFSRKIEKNAVFIEERHTHKKHASDEIMICRDVDQFLYSQDIRKIYFMSSHKTHNRSTNTPLEDEYKVRNSSKNTLLDDEYKVKYRIRTETHMGKMKIIQITSASKGR